VAKKVKILVVDDQKHTALFFSKSLMKSDYETAVAFSGLDALKKLKTDTFEIVVVDWLMPGMDGLELIKRIRSEFKDPPLLLMITAQNSQEHRMKAMESGADEFLSKPIMHDDLANAVDSLIKRNIFDITLKITKPKPKKLSLKPPFPALCVAASTGGPPALLEFFKKLSKNPGCPIFIVQHGPAWMLESFAGRIEAETGHKTLLAKNGMLVKINEAYLAPGDFHMIFDSKNFEIKLNQDPMVNYVRPSADPLLFSVAEAFGKYAVSVVLTGLGCDAAAGSESIVSNGGGVYIQDPKKAVAPSMPRSVVKLNIPHFKADIGYLAQQVGQKLLKLKNEL
jgi:two-component system, chemotaxis family, protein-glutamate methylesterase/glutaminase